jgi:hypothetical protein
MEMGIVEVCSVLYSSGLGMHSGGAVAGLLAFTLEKTVSVFGAVPVVLILMIFFLFVGANMTPRSLIEAIRSRQPYDPDVYDDEEYIPRRKADDSMEDDSVFQKKNEQGKKSIAKAELKDDKKENDGEE